MDLTAEFRRLAAAMKGKVPKESKLSSEPNDKKSDQQKNVVAAKALTPIFNRAKDNIMSLAKKVHSNRSLYAHVPNALALRLSSEGSMDTFEREVQNSMIQCRAALDHCNCDTATARSQLLTSQAVHFDAVLDILQLLLKRVGQVFDQLQRLRLKRVLTTQALKFDTMARKRQRATKVDHAPNATDNTNGTSKPSVHTATATKRKAVFQTTPQDDDRPETQTATNMDELELENATLVREFATIEDDVKAAETKVVEITRLQTVLSEKIAEQSVQLETVFENTVAAGENVAAGNDNLRQAVRSNIDFRMGVFLFYLMCAFCLLFLDWYNS